MNPRVKKVEPLPDYRLGIWFDNGERREFDVTPFLDRGVFKELKNEDYFARVRVAFGSVAWPNEQDLSYDTLYILSEPSPPLSSADHSK